MNPDTKKPIRLSFNEVADPKTLDWFSKIHDRLDFLLGALKGIKIEFPKLYQVQGTVNVDSVKNLPPVNISNLSDLRAYFVLLDQSINNLQKSILKISQAMPPEKDVVFPDQMKITGFNELLDAQEELKKGFNLLLKKDFGGALDGPVEVSVVSEPARMIPQPVTHMSINGLGGFAQSSNVTVASTPTALPSTPLANRRTLILYNNSANTIYLGGADVNTTNGLPVVATSFSPAIDAGANMIIYAIADSDSETRVLEVGDEASGR